MFFRGFEGCLLGQRVRSRSELGGLLGDISGTGPLREARQMIEYFFVNIDRKRAARVPSIR
jgi:hypothetical protein